MTEAPPAQQSTAAAIDAALWLLYTFAAEHIPPADDEVSTWAKLSGSIAIARRYARRIMEDAP